MYACDGEGLMCVVGAPLAACPHKDRVKIMRWYTGVVTRAEEGRRCVKGKDSDQRLENQTRKAPMAANDAHDATPTPAEGPPPEEEEVEQQVASFFVEAEEVLALIRSFSDEKAHHAAAADKLAAALDRYQEQPSILDPQLEAMVTPLLESVRKVSRGTSPEAVLPHACRVMYTLCKVRGYKTIVKFVPHEVADLEPLVDLLARVDPADHSSWQVAYAIMVWLSMVVMVPFDLSIIDSAAASSRRWRRRQGQPARAVHRADHAGAPRRDGRATPPRSSSPASSRAPDSSAARASSPGRPGAPKGPPPRRRRGGGHRRRGGAVGGGVGGAVTRATFLMVGIYSALAQIFKLGHRSELLPQLPLLGSLVSDPSALLNDHSVTRRKLGIKLLQRAAAVHLPPRVATWRYQRGARSLEQNLQLTSGGGGGGGGGGGAVAEAKGREAAAAEEDDEEDEVPEAIEEILEQLLRGLRDADTVVRWSAAKGIGRVTARLALEMADDIVESVLELLNKEEEANAWHGGCLALAELSRRGLLLPSRLGEVLPRIVTALHYDVPRGATSVGTHVRDAACYVCWAFARAFEPSVMAPHVATLARALLIVVVFDREVNCRRAASAAFQENVGRQGNFPHGIEIVTRADYFTVGSRPNAYLHIGSFLGTFDAYRVPLLEHLATVKFKHWDAPLRLLAAQAASRLAPLDEAYTLETMVPFLITKTLSADLKARHGATHMLAEVLLGLVRTNHHGDGRALPPETRKAIANVVPAIEKARLYRGRGGEVMRGATARLLEVLATLRMPCGPKAAAKHRHDRRRPQAPDRHDLARGGRRPPRGERRVRARRRRREPRAALRQAAAHRPERGAPPRLHARDRRAAAEPALPRPRGGDPRPRPRRARRRTPSRATRRRGATPSARSSTWRRRPASPPSTRPRRRPCRARGRRREPAARRGRGGDDKAAAAAAAAAAVDVNDADAASPPPPPRPPPPPVRRARRCAAGVARCGGGGAAHVALHEAVEATSPPSTIRPTTAATSAAGCARRPSHRCSPCSPSARRRRRAATGPRRRARWRRSVPRAEVNTRRARRGAAGALRALRRPPVPAGE